MATEIFHGPPGSYKSSSVTWFKLVDALRQGRLVVTNVQGLKTVEQIQAELNEVFPPSAQIYRVSIGSDVGLKLMRSFYWWLPIGAFLFIDEVQDVFPNDKSFKAADYDYQGEGVFNEFLSDEIIALYHATQQKIKSNVDVDEYKDDMGNSLFDERDYLRYPRTLRECFMRHRHYNWDIILATPDIKEVHPFIRSVAEVAYSHKTRDHIPFPYFKRRPLIFQHSAKENGLVRKKENIIINRKIPLEVFKLYKSTATGNLTAKGVSNSPVTTSLKLALLSFIAIIVYLSIYLGSFFSDEEIKEPVKSSPVPISNNTQAGKAANEVDKVGVSKPAEASKNTNDVFRSNGGLQSPFEVSNTLAFPYAYTEMYLTGVVTKYITDSSVTRDYIFSLKKADIEVSITSEQLFALGYKIYYQSDCLVKLSYGSKSALIPCLLNPVDNRPIQENTIDTKPVLASVI